MDNDEIRLSILSHYYRLMFDGKEHERRTNDPELEGVSSIVISANQSYLMDKGLLEGEKIRSRAGMVVFCSGITAWGMDIVEKIMKDSLESIDDSISSEIKKEDSTSKRFDKFYEKCIKVAPIFENVIKIAGPILSNL